MLPKQYDFAITKAKKIIVNNNIFPFLSSYKFDVDARFEKEAAGGEELVNVFQSWG